MKYAVSSWIYAGESLEIIFKRLAECGYGAIELEGEPLKYDSAKIKELCRRYNISVSGLAGIYPWPTVERDLSSVNSEIRRKAVEYLKSCINFANDLEAPLVIVVPSTVGKTAPTLILKGEKDILDWDEEFNKEWELARDSMDRCTQEALSKGVMLAVEPINRYETYMINTCRQGLDFIAPLDHSVVKLHLDTFHMNIEEADPVQALLDAGPLLVNLHVADSNRQAAGRGHTDFLNMLRALKSIDYRGVLSLEPLPPVSNPYAAMKLDRYRAMRDDIARESIKFLRYLEGSVNSTTTQ